MLDTNFTGYILNSLKDNWEKNALADYEGETFKFSEVADYIVRIHKFFECSGIGEGDKIALVGKNSARWGIIYLATVTYGAVIVPILSDFKEDDMHEIINHSDAVMLFSGESIIEKVNLEKLPSIKCLLSIEKFSVVSTNQEELKSCWDKTFNNSPIIEKEKFVCDEVPNDKLAVISYTSGTTGNAKGVMIDHNSLAANVLYARNNMPLKPGDQIVSFLPMAHTFGCAFEFLFPFSLGCHITILTKTPSPQIIIKAFQDIKPALVLTVPLIIEKIYTKQILPILSTPKMKILLAIPLINRIVLNKIRQKLISVFGGKAHEIVIGGAPLNRQAERFLKKAKFPFTVGYGMTECGPLISYASWTENPAKSSGRVIDTLEMKIDSPNQSKVVGEIMVRGENILLGYYKNDKATNEILDEDGWLHTGDLGTINKKGFLFIKGRSKSMFLGPNGRNIYPEIIESVFDTKPGVAESLVVQRGEKLVAMIYPDKDYVENKHLNADELKLLMEDNRQKVNNYLPDYIHIHEVEIRSEEFQKTPKRNIRRFLYK